jgi:hypothetical protein
MLIMLSGGAAWFAYLGTTKSRFVNKKMLASVSAILPRSFLKCCRIDHHHP